MVREERGLALSHPLDNSQLAKFKSCQFMYKMAIEEGWAKQESDADDHDLRYGQAIHEALKEWYISQDMQKAISLFCTHYSQQLDMTDMAKTQENGVRLLEGYFLWAKQNDSKFKVLKVEEVEEFEPVVGLKYLVKLDVIMQRTDTGEVVGIDHKTTGKLPNDETFWAQFEPNDGLIGYSAYIQSKYGACGGIYINQLSFGYRQRASKYGPAGFHYDFRRNLYNHSPQQIARWKLELGAWSKKIEESRLSNVWLKNTGACRFCSFRPVCIAEWNPDEPADQDLIAIQYKKKNPLEYLGIKKEED